MFHVLVSQASCTNGLSTSMRRTNTKFKSKVETVPFVDQPGPQTLNTNCSVHATSPNVIPIRVKFKASNENLSCCFLLLKDTFFDRSKRWLEGTHRPPRCRLKLDLMIQLQGKSCIFDHLFEKCLKGYIIYYTYRLVIKHWRACIRTTWSLLRNYGGWRGWGGSFIKEHIQVRDKCVLLTKMWGKRVNFIKFCTTLNINVLIERSDGISMTLTTNKRRE